MQEFSNDKKWRQTSSIIKRYQSRKATQNDKELSPWNNDEYKKMFQPQQYYETITVQNKRQQRRHYNSKSLSLGDHPSLLGNRISKQFMQLVKHQKKGAYMHYDEKRNEEHQLKMNLVNVNLDDNLIQYQEKKYGQTLDSFYNNKQINHSDNSQKQQPVRVRMFKKILEKNKSLDENERMDFSQAYQIQMHLPELRSESNTLYQAMPRRTPRLSQQRKKVQSTIQTSRNDFFPQLPLEKNKSSQERGIAHDQGFFCKGEIIAKKDNQSKRKMKYRQFQTNDSRKTNQQNILFLQQFSSQR